MKKDEQAKKQTEDFHYVYFIESHLSEALLELRLVISNKDLIGPLENKKKEKYTDEKTKRSFIYNIYRFQFYPEKIKDRGKDKLEIKVELEDKEKKIFTYEITITDFGRDYYVYDAEFKEKRLIGRNKSPESIKFSRAKQFEIYENFLQKDSKIKKLDSPERLDLVFWTQKLLKEKFTFFFYIMIFLESFNTSLLSTLISYFDTYKIDESDKTGDITKSLRKIKNYVNICIKNPSKTFTNINESEKKEETWLKFFTFSLYFYKEYCKEEFRNFMEVNIDKSQFYINNVLTNNFYLFSKEKFPPEKIKTLIDASNTYTQFVNSLRYLDNISEFFDIIFQYFPRFEELYNSENKRKERVNIEEIITPRKEDNMKEICQKYMNLVNIQKEEFKCGNKDLPIFMSESLFDKYISYFEGVDINNLFEIKEVTKSLNIEIQKDINKSIFETGLSLSEKGKITNLEILDIINKLIKDERKKESIEILSKLNIKNFNEDFYKEWNKVSWFKVYEKYIKVFIDKILGLIKNVKDFDILFKLFNISDKENIIKIYASTLETMQIKFIELLQNYDNKENINFNESIISLIINSDTKQKGTKNDIEFLKKIRDYFNSETIKEIYKAFLSKHGEELTWELKKFLIDYFTKEIEVNAKIVLDVIKDCPDKIIEIFFENLNKYIPNEKDFLSIEKNEKYDLFKGLLDNKIITKEDFKYTFYMKQANEKLSKLQKELKTGEFKFPDIFIFYDEKNKKEGLLLSKLKTIFLNDEKEANSVQSSLDNYNKTIKIKLDDLNLILEDFLEFLNISEKENIINIRIHINCMNTGALNYYENNKEKIDKLINDNKQNAIKRNNLKNSSFFINIYKRNKQLYKQNDEKYWLDSTENDFQDLNKIFNDKGLKDLDSNILNICIDTIKGKSKEIISEEINKLLDLFGKQITDIEKNIIIEGLMALAKKDDIIIVSKAISVFIERANLDKGTLWDLLKEIIDNEKALIEPQKIEQYIVSLKNHNIDINTLYDNNEGVDNYLNILLNLRKLPDAIDFLMGKGDEDCRRLEENAGNNDTGFLNISDIKDFEKCVLFKNKLGNKGNIKNMLDDDFIILFQKEVKKSKDIELYFSKYINNFSELKNLFDLNFDKSSTAKNKIISICRKSLFTFKNKKKEFFECTYWFFIEKKNKEKEEKEEKIKIPVLKELRERAHITKKTNNKEEKDVRETFNEFINKVNIIFKIYDSIKEFYSIGYFKDINIKVEINDKKATYIGLGLNTENSEDIISKMKNELDSFKKMQNSAYRDKAILRYVYGRQFNLLYDKIYNKVGTFDINPLLMFISNNVDIQNIKLDDNNFKINNEKDEYENIESYLNGLLNLNKINKVDIEKKYEIKNTDDDFKGIYTFKGDIIQKEVIQIYKYITNKIPQAQYILLCNKETTNEELTAFLYRAIFCDYHSCFIIASVESLPFDQKNRLQSLLDELYTKNLDEKKMKSCLIIVYTNYDEDIIKSIMSLKGRKYLKNEKEIIAQEIDDTNSKVKIISSDQAGVGKSTYIKSEIKKSGKNYIYFPIGGVFTRKDILKRLKKLNITNNSAIHLDLYDTEQIDLTMEFLFSILITKIYGQNEDIFYLPKDIEIIIEIPNGFVDFMKKFPILGIFPKEELSIKNLKDLIVPKDITSNVQIVANYIKILYNNPNVIDERDLYFKGISPDDFANFPTRTDAVTLPQNECQNLIFKKIKERITEPNYYQINSFIEVLGSQLKKFSQNRLLSAQLLNEFKPHIRQLRDIRSYIVIKIIEFTKYFTEGTFSNFIKTFKKSYSQLIRRFDEDKDNEEAIERLAKEIDTDEVVSFDKVKPSLFIFDEGNGEGFRIISNQINENEVEVNKYSYIYRTQVMNDEFYRIPIFDNQDEKVIQKEILKELKSLLSINNEVGEGPVNNQDNTQNSETNNKKSQNKKDNKKEPEKNKNTPEKKEDSSDDEEDEEDEEINEKDNIEEGIDKKEKTLYEIIGKYVLTTDNYFKMALILLKLRAGIPVIMMGETGCGKTSLIRKLSQLFNNGAKDRMKILNIHAGTSDKDIIKFLEKTVIPSAMKLKEIEGKTAEIMRRQGLIYYEKKLWVFLDEINTCKSMGLISEIMCKQSYQGKELPKNITFIAACNPYRYDTKKIKQKAGLNQKYAFQDKLKIEDPKIRNLMEKSSEANSLIYTVNPLPHSLLNYVFNFGNVKDDDEKKYIKSITSEIIEKIYNNKYNENLGNKGDIHAIHKLAIDLIVTSQNFIRDKNDKSSVSLREIRRFNIFYEFFFNYLKNKKLKTNENSDNMKMEKDDNDFIKDLDFNNMQIYSIILSIFVCYYLRLTESDTREELKNKLNQILYEFGYKRDFLEVPEREEKLIANNIELEKGIAKNKALLENLFALFVTINTKVPIFIVGKPGCSKSLSVQLINKSMKGKTSDNNLFKKLPRIIMSSFQGSMGSTSKGVKSVFKKARNILKNVNKENEENKKNKEKSSSDKEEIISMIFFDEMGLAEHSPNNPLKVIHSELEYDLNEGHKKIAFVGISNWALDASKMNRGLFLSIPDPDIEDAKKTSFTIGESYNPDLAKNYKSLYENLGETYINYKNDLNSHFNDELREFHGNRDFYHLVKNVASNITDTGKNSLDNNIKNDFIVQGIERNFAGLVFEKPKETSLKTFKTEYQKKDPNIQSDYKYDVLKRIEENIKDLKSRYLLVISKPSISEFLISTILSAQNKEYNYYKGSPFKDDQKSEDYILKMLNKIQLSMEQNKVLILNNLGTVYPGLYDLFNQNFTVISKKNYARIALGYTTNAYSIVNDEFRCIVNVDEDKIYKEEPPFLNRFEKHIISFEYLLDQNYIDKSNDIYKNLLKLTENDTNKIFEGINYNLKDIFINLDKEEIQGYIYKIIKNGVDGEKMEDLADKVIDKISLLLPQDIILFQKYSRKCPYSDKIINGYKKGEHTNLSLFLKKMKNMKNVVYTFSDFFTKIENLENVENDLLGVINQDNIFDISISSFTSENKFEEKLSEYFSEENKNKKLCIIKFKSDERDFLNYVKFFIENMEKENKDKKNIDKKAFIFIVYLDRTFDDEVQKIIIKKYRSRSVFGDDSSDEQNETISLTSDFYQIFIDDLNGEEKCTLNDFLELNGEILFKKCIDFDQRLKENIYTAFSYIKFDIPYGIGELNEDNYIKKLIELIQSDTKLRDKINKIIIKQMEKGENLIEKALKTKNLVRKSDIDIISSIQRYLNEHYSHLVNNFYYLVEQDQFFSTLLSVKTPKMKVQKEEKDIIEEEEDDDNNNEIKKDNQNKEEEENKYKVEIIQNVIEFYLNKYLPLDENINNDNDIEYKKINNNMIENIQANEIKIVLGLNLPGMYSIISSLIKKSKNEIIKKYHINENRLRKDMEDQEEIRNNIIIYEQKMKSFNESLSNELNKNNEIKQINEIINKDDLKKGEFIELFLEDYYTIFIYNNLNNYIKNLKQNNKDFIFDISNLVEMIKFFVRQKKFSFEDDKDNKIEIENIGSIINWLEFYSNQISYMLKIYLMLNDYLKKIENFKNIHEELDKISNSIVYENDEKNNEYKSEVNKGLFIGIESILKIITSNPKIFLESNKDKFSKLININKEIMNQMKKFIINLNIHSQEILSIEEILVIIDYVNNKGKYKTETLKKILEYFTKVADNNEQPLNNFEEYHNNLENLLGKENDREYFKMMSFIFKNEFNKFSNIGEIKRKIIEIITSKDGHILNNNAIFKSIMTFDITPDNIKENINKILENDDILPIINQKCNNELLEQLIFNTYDYEFEKYFSRTPNTIIEKIANNNVSQNEREKLFKAMVEANKEAKKYKIVFDLSFDVLKDCIQFLEDLNEYKEKNYNIAKLYSISYIKIYFRILVDFSLNKINELGSIQDIIKFLDSKQTNIRKVIKIYIIKLFLRSKNNNMEEFKNITFQRLQYEFIPQMLGESNQESKTIEELIKNKNKINNPKYENDYPFIKYFTKTLSAKEVFAIFQNKILKGNQNAKAFPVLYKYLIENKDIEKKIKNLKYVEIYNEFCNFMIDNYSFKISREDAIKKILKEEPIFQTVQNKFRNFKICWNDICKYAVNYKNEKLPEKKLNEEDSLAYYLNDINEKGYGMYMAAGYEFFIKLQNNFLQYILDNGENKSYLNFYFDTIKNKIPIYEANNNQILLIFDLYSYSEYDNFRDLINTFTNVNIFDENGKVDFDIDEIEKEISKLILTGKCMFEDEDNLNLINYWGEGFSGGKSDFLQRFEKLYKTNELSELNDDEKKNINSYISHNYDKNDPNDFKKIYGDIQILIFYLINNDSDPNKTISSVINDLPDYIKNKFDVNFSGIFNAGNKELEVSKLISIFLFFEHLCFESFTSSLNEEYKKKIEEKDKNAINDKFLKGNQNNTKALAAAVRRFISRFLYRITNENDFSSTMNLSIKLKRMDLWDKNFRNEKTINDILSSLNDFNLTVGQSYEFYQLINKEDEKEINAYAEDEQQAKKEKPEKRKRKFKN